MHWYFICKFFCAPQIHPSKLVTKFEIQYLMGLWRSIETLESKYKKFEDFDFKSLKDNGMFTQLGVWGEWV